MRPGFLRLLAKQLLAFLRRLKIILRKTPSFYSIFRACVPSLSWESLTGRCSKENSAPKRRFIFRTHRSGIEIVRRPAACLLDLLVQLFAGERLPKVDIAHHLCVVRAVAVDLGGVSSPTETPLFFECFPYVCPEPFLVK